MSTTTAPLSIQERVALASDLVDWITDAGGVIQSLAIYPRKGNAFGAAIVFQVAGDEAGVDVLADLLNLGEPRTYSWNYERNGTVRGLGVSAYSGRSKPVCTCRAECHHGQVPA